jgi:hypothetical protein
LSKIKLVKHATVNSVFRWFSDLYFGPEVPAGKPESNWIKTIPGKGWFTYFRLYGPTQPYFDRSWVLPDIEEIQ